MKYFMLIAFLIAIISCKQKKDNFESGDEFRYDTISTIKVTSKKAFYFCSKKYELPKDCDNGDNPGCCTFSGQKNMGEENLDNLQVSCINGPNLHWRYDTNEKNSEKEFNLFVTQMRANSKSLVVEPVDLFLDGTKVVAYKTILTGYNNHSFYEIKFYGTVNKTFVQGGILLLDSIGSSKNLPKALQQLIKF